jgi:hypothetical protein
VDTTILCFIAAADHEGILVAIALTLLCIPFAVAARARRLAAISPADGQTNDPPKRHANGAAGDPQ